MHMTKHNTKKWYRNNRKRKPATPVTHPEIENKKSAIPLNATNEPISWEDYSHIHDSFIELLSYDWNKKYSRSNVWEYAYV